MAPFRPPLLAVAAMVALSLPDAAVAENFSPFTPQHQAQEPSIKDPACMREHWPPPINTSIRDHLLGPLSQHHDDLIFYGLNGTELGPGYTSAILAYSRELFSCDPRLLAGQAIVQDFLEGRRPYSDVEHAVLGMIGPSAIYVLGEAVYLGDLLEFYAEGVQWAEHNSCRWRMTRQRLNRFLIVMTSFAWYCAQPDREPL